MRPRWLRTPALLFLHLSMATLLSGCAPARSQQPAAVRSAPDGEGITFELAGSKEQTFRRALQAFVSFGLPVDEASLSAGSITTGPYQWGAAMSTTYEISIRGTDRLSRVLLRGTVTAPELGFRGEPITEAQFGVRAKFWSHLSRLARTIETQPLAQVIPEEMVHRSRPD